MNGNVTTYISYYTVLLSAIACHKFVISFCVSLELVQANTRKFIFFSYLSTFSLMSGVGIAIGIIITEAGSGTIPEVVNATLQGSDEYNPSFIFHISLRPSNCPQ